MDKQFLLPNSFAADYKLTKSASFSELSSKKKIIIEKQYETQTHGNLIKQYSCEEIFDKKSNTSQITLSQAFKTNNAERIDTWEKTLPTPIKSKWLNNTNMQTDFQSSFSNPNQTFTEANVNSRAIILPAKLIVAENKLNQLSINEQNNLCDDKQIYLKNENSIGASNYLFKKPLPLPSIKKARHETIDNFDKNKKITNDACTVLPNEENNKHKLDTSQLKKRLRSLVALKPKKKSKIHFCWILTFFILLPVAIIYLAFVLNNSDTTSGFCTPRFNLKKITQELKKFVYDQDFAINELARFFDERENQTSFEIIAFVGGIGVGKSYTAEIIKNNIIDSDKILNFFPPLYNKEDQAYESLSVCRCNFIRLENLKTDDIPDAANFISNLKRRTEKYCVLVLAIFNTEELDHNLKRTIDFDRSISMIKNTFGEVNLQVRVVKFTSLSNEALVKCIKDAGEYNNLKLSVDNINYVMRDLLTAESGCKGAYAKVQLVGKN